MPMRKVGKGNRNNKLQIVKRGVRLRIILARSSKPIVAEETNVKAQRIVRLSKWCFDLASKLCASLCLLPMTRKSEYEFEEASRRRKIIFCVILACQVPLAVHKYLVFIQRLTSDLPVDATTCFCMLPCVIYGVYGIFMTVLICKQPEARLFVKDFPVIVRQIQDEESPNLSPHDDLGSAATGIQIFGSLMGSALGYTLTAVVLPDLPFLILPTLVDLGVVEYGNIPPLVWQLGFSLLETVQYGIPFTVITFVGQLAMMELGLSKLYMLKTRRDTTDLDSHYRQRRLYNIYRLHSKGLALLYQDVVTPVLFLIGGCIVFLLYLVLRDRTLPTFIVIVQTYTAFALLAVVYFLAYNISVITQSSEDIVQNLQTADHDYYDGAPAEVKAENLKAGKALTPVEFPVGHFTTFSFGVTQTVYEETLNQLLFLLSL